MQVGVAVKTPGGAPENFPLAHGPPRGATTHRVRLHGTPLEGAESTLMVQRVERDDGVGGFYVRTGTQRRGRDGTTHRGRVQYGEGGVMRNGSLSCRAPWTGELVGRPHGTLHDLPASG